MVTELDFSGTGLTSAISADGPVDQPLACLAMIAAAHGSETTLNNLRQRIRPGTETLSFAAVSEIASDLGLTPRVIRASDSEIASLNLPALGQMRGERYVVLISVRGRDLQLHDPARGDLTMPLADFAGSKILEFSPAAKLKPQPNRETLKLQNLWSNVKGLGSALGHVFVLSAILQLIALSMPFQMQLVIDQGLSRGDQDILLLIAVTFAFLVGFQVAVDALRGWTVQVVGQSLAFQMIGNVVHHLMRLRPDYFQTRHVGDILSRVSSARSIQDILTRGVVQAVIDGGMAMIAGVILFIYSPSLALVVLSFVLMTLAIAWIAFPFLRARSECELDERAKEQSALMELVRAATVIKLMGGETEREGAWRSKLARATNASIGIVRLNLWVGGAQNLCAALQTVLVIYLGAGLVVRNEGMSIGMLVAFLAFRQMFTDRSMTLVTQIMQFRMIDLHLDRLGDIVRGDTEEDLGSMPHLDPTRLSFRNVSFRYDQAERHILHQCSLEIRPGELVAITGPTGEGKTTVLKLLTGLRTPTEGEVLIGGVRATPQLWRQFRKYAGVISQDDRLLTGTIAENIAFFDPDLDMGRVREAAAMAYLDGDIDAMPDGYLSGIGDMGSSLSGGQRQRMLLARALYRRPQVLILDEGTANLDLETERRIVSLLRDLPLTRIVVAHRPAIIDVADRVFDVRSGRVSEYDRAASMSTRPIPTAL